MNYKTYAEAKIANPDSEIYCAMISNDGRGIYGKLIDINMVTKSHYLCNPADHCSSLEDYFDAGFKLVRGDWVVTLNGIAGKVRSVSAMNGRDFNDGKRYILSVAALNGGCKIPDQKAVQLALQAKINEKRKMRQFNLEEAKDGKPICTRDGRSARIICTNRICGELSIVALVMSRFGTEDATSHTLSGQYFGGDGASPMDLFMETAIEKRWIAVNPYTRAASFLHSSKEECEDFMVCIGDTAGYQAIEVEVEI